MDDVKNFGRRGAEGEGTGRRGWGGEALQAGHWQQIVGMNVISAEGAGRCTDYHRPG